MIFCSEISFFDDCGRFIYLKLVRKVFFLVVFLGIFLWKMMNFEIVFYKVCVGMFKFFYIDCVNS